MVTTAELIKLGLYVVEIRRRRQDKVLQPWTPVAAFVTLGDADAAQRRYSRQCHACVVLPEPSDQIQECTHKTSPLPNSSKPTGSI